MEIEPLELARSPDTITPSGPMWDRLTALAKDGDWRGFFDLFCAYATRFPEETHTRAWVYATAVYALVLQGGRIMKALYTLHLTRPGWIDRMEESFRANDFDAFRREIDAIRVEIRYGCPRARVRLEDQKWFLGPHFYTEIFSVVERGPVEDVAKNVHYFVKTWFQELIYIELRTGESPPELHTSFFVRGTSGH